MKPPLEPKRSGHSGCCRHWLCKMSTVLNGGLPLTLIPRQGGGRPAVHLCWGSSVLIRSHKRDGRKTKEGDSNNTASVSSFTKQTNRSISDSGFDALEKRNWVGRGVGRMRWFRDLNTTCLSDIFGYSFIYFSPDRHVPVTTRCTDKTTIV